jgi:hypothetical protein
VHRVCADARRVVAVLVAAGDAVHTLADQVVEAVRHLRLLARVAQTIGQSLRQTQAPVARLEQHRAAIGARIGLVEARHHSLTEQILENNRLSRGIVWHVKASCTWENWCRNRFLTRQRPSVCLNS